MTAFEIGLDVTWLTLVATILLPMLTAVVTARLAHPGLKAGILALLALIAATANELLEAGATSVVPDFSSIVATALGVFLGAVGFHYGLLKPTAVTGGDGAIARALPAGLGNQVRAQYDETGGPR